MAKKDIEIGVKTTGEGVKTLKQELREAVVLAQQLSSAEIIDQKALENAVARAAELKDRMNDVNEQVGVLTAGSKFEALSNQLGDISGKIMSLDFEGANESAQRLVKLTKTITFAEASKGLKDLGMTFLNLGKALLTNPLFLIAAVVAGIIAAIVALMDKLGFLEAITEAIGAVFEWFSDMIDLASDALWAMVEGLDAVAAAERNLAREQSELAEENEKRIKKIGATRTAEFDRTIKLAQSEGKNTADLERERLLVIADTDKKERASLAARYEIAKKYGWLSKEELTKLKDQLDEVTVKYKDSVADLKIFDNTTERENKEKAKQQAADASAAAKQRKADREREAKERLDLARQTEDILLSIKVDGEAKDVELTNVKFDRLIADNKKNTELVKALELQRQSELEKIRLSYDQKEIDQEKTFQQALDDIKKGSTGLTEVEKLEIERQEKIAKLKEMATDEQETRKEFEEAMLQINADYAQKTKDLQEKEETKKLEILNTLSNTEYETKKANLERLMQLELDNTNLTEEEKEAIRQKYATTNKDLDDQETARKLKEIDDEKQIRDAKISIASDVANGLTAIGGAFIKDQKKLEKFNKASALVQIGIDTARAISGLIAASQANPLNAPTGGIAGAAQFASGIVQIVTNVAKAKQILSGAGSSTPSPNNSPAPSPSSTQTITSSGGNGTAPQFNLFGTAGNFNTNNNNNNNNNNMNVTVSVEEINRVQGNVVNINENSFL